jgi:hypothetical protein
MGRSLVSVLRSIDLLPSLKTGNYTALTNDHPIQEIPSAMREPSFLCIHAASMSEISQGITADRLIAFDYYFNT